MSLHNLSQRTTVAKVPMSNTFSLTMSPKESRAAASLGSDTLHRAPDRHLRMEGYNLAHYWELPQCETIICASSTGYFYRRRH
jgi:hypothetical protein